MASDRSSAKRTAKNPDAADPELDAAFEAGHAAQLSLAQEANRHAAEMTKAELGVCGRFLGGEKSAPTAIAAIVLVVGLTMVAGCLIMTANDASAAQFWDTQINRLIAVCTTVLGFILGRGAKK